MIPPGLSVYIDDGRTRRMVTQHCSSLRFTKVAPGGHQMLQVQMTLPHGTFPNLGPNDRITVTDQRTGRIIFDGYLKNPTPVDGRAGQFFDLTALGGMWRASDESRPLSYVTQDLGGFEKATDTVASANVEAGSQIAGTDYPGVQVQFPNGSLAATNDFASAGNWVLQRAGLELGAFHAVVLGGKTDANWASELVNTAGTITTGPLGPGPTSYDVYVGAGTGLDLIPPGTDVFAFRLRRTGGSTNVADEDTWLRAAGVYVLGRRMDRNGDLLTGAAGMGTTLGVTATDVVEDLLGRLLTMCDPATAVVEATTFLIDQLAYPDATKAAQVLTDLLGWEYDYTWEIGERLSNGLHRFGFRAWPTTPRYVVSVADGWVESGSDQNVCNRVLVTFTDSAGASQALAVTASDLLADGLVTAADLDGVGDGLTAGQIRDADRFPLPDGTGSAANAARVGRGVLLDTIKPPRAGKVTVRRKIMDLLTGNEVWPWELEPGYVCRVREKGYDLRVTEADYDHADQDMVLTLGKPVLTADQRTARLDAA